MERRRPLGGNPESLIHRLVDDTAPDVDVDEEDFVHRMFAEFHHNSRTDGFVDQDRERQLRQSEEPVNLIELFVQEGTTSGSARLLALQVLCAQPGAMPTHDPIDMAAALQAAGEREPLTSLITDSQKSLTDIVRGIRHLVLWQKLRSCLQVRMRTCNTHMGSCCRLGLHLIVAVVGNAFLKQHFRSLRFQCALPL